MADKHPPKRPVNPKVASWKAMTKNVDRALGRELGPAIYDQFHVYYLAASAAPEDTTDIFMGMMAELSEGNVEMDTIENETKLIAKKVPSLEKYLKTYLIGHVMTVAAIRYGDAPTDIEIEIPPLDKYIFAIMQRVAQEAEANPDLFNPNGGRREIKQRQLDAYIIIKEAIHETTADILPTDQMIDRYIEDIGEDSGSDYDESDAEDANDESEFIVTAADMGCDPNTLPPTETEPPKDGNTDMKIQIPKKNWEANQGGIPNAPPMPPKPNMMAGMEDASLD